MSIADLAERFARRLRGFGPDRRATSAVEFAAWAPVVLLIAVGAYDYGRAYVDTLRLTEAARAGAAEALHAPSGWQDSSHLESVALDAYLGDAVLDPDYPVSAAASAFCACESAAPGDCTAMCPDGRSPGRFVRLTTFHTLPLTLPYPWVDGRETQLSGGAVMRVR